MTTELARRQPEESAIQQINVADLLQQIIKAGVTSDAAGAVKELVLLAEHRADRDAKQQWMAAFARVRGKMKTINASKGIPGKKEPDGTFQIRWHYAPLEDLQDAVEPILELEEMTLRFDSRLEENKVIGVCWVGHSSGHQEKGECAITVAGCEGGDLGALKKAKRGAMTGILGIKTRHMGDDAAFLGDCITQDQADALRARAVALGGDWPDRIMRYINKMGFEDYPKIRQGKYATVDEGIRKAEKKTSLPTGASGPHGGAPVPENSQAKGEVESKAAGLIGTSPAAGPATSPPSDALSHQDEAREYGETMTIADLRRTLQGASVGPKALKDALMWSRGIAETKVGPLPLLLPEYTDEQIRVVAESFRLYTLMKGK